MADFDSNFSNFRVYIYIYIFPSHLAEYPKYFPNVSSTGVEHKTERGSEDGHGLGGPAVVGENLGDHERIVVKVAGDDEEKSVVGPESPVEIGEIELGSTPDAV